MEPAAETFISAKKRLLLKQIKRLLLKQILSAAGLGLKSFDPSRRTELLGLRRSAGDPLKRGQGHCRKQPAVTAKVR
jgi:hypothetical protein